MIKSGLESLFTLDRSGTLDVFNENLKYEQYVFQKEYYPYQFDSFNDQKQYGLYNNGFVIYPKISSLKTYTNNNGNTHKNLSFVVDAFNDLKNFQNTRSRKNDTLKFSLYTDLNVFDSTTDVHTEYHQHIIRMYDIFSQTYLTDIDKNNIKSLNDFVNYFIKFINIVAKISPFNRSTFIKSKSCSPFSNGLRIGLQPWTYRTTSEQKEKLYINNQDFDKFVDIATRYGFVIDRNYPWIIVADLDSPNMLRYASNYNLNNKQEIFDNLFHKAHEADIDSLKNLILSFWNGFAASTKKTNSAIDIKNCKNVFQEQNYMKQLSISTFETFFNINWQLRFYLYTRILEEKLDIQQNKFEYLHQESCKINKYYGIVKAADYINQKILEIIATNMTKPESLTNPDAVVKLLSEEKFKTPVQGLIF